MATKAIPVTAAKVAATLTDYPAYVKPSAITGWGALTSAEANSLRFFSDSGLTTELAREIVSADEIHVKVPSLSTTTTIYADYDGLRSDYATTATYGAEAVWSDYRFVWHGSTALNSADGQTLLTSGGITLGGATGQVGAATDFDGTDDIVYLNDTALVSVGTSDFTIQSWVNPDVVGFQPFFNAGKRTATGEAWALDIHADGTYGFLIQEGSSGFQFAQGGSYSTATWAMMHTTFDRSGNGTLYVNGSSLTSSSISAESASIDPPYGLSIGARRNSSASDFLSFFNGKAQQTRMRIGLLSGNWITTEYNNQSDVGSFWGTATDAGSSSPTTFSLTVNASKVAATLTDYPAYVDLADMPASFWAEVSNGGGDIRCYSDSGLTTELAREVVSCDTAVSTGEMHVKVPSLTTSSVIYVTIDGTSTEPASNSTYGSEAVWSDYALVWHGGTATDSSGNATLTAEGGVTTGGATGKLGDATSFDGTNDRYTVSNTTALGQAGDVFMSCWAYGTTDSTGPHIFGGYDQTYYPGYGMQLQANTQKFRLWDGVGWRASTTNVSTSNLQHLAARVSSGNWKLFHNGSGDGSGSGSSITANSNAKSIAARGATLNDRTFNGVMEEMRVRRDVTNITDNWITTEYNNQSDPTTFWTIAEEGGGGGGSTNNATFFGGGM